MVVYENQSDRMTVKAYSNEGKYIQGGSPFGKYVEAYDPIGAHREYEETDEYIPTLPTPPYKTYSKLKLKMALAKLGKLQALESWLATVEVAPNYSAIAAWNDAQDISDSFDGFADMYLTVLLVLLIDPVDGAEILQLAELK